MSSTLSTETLQYCKANYDWVLIEKLVHLDGAKKVGLIEIPGSVNTNIRESKLGKILSVGPGYYDVKGRYRGSDLHPGDVCYYTRYAKEQVESIEGDTFVFTRFRGVLAKVVLVDDYPVVVEPYWNNLWVTEVNEEERRVGSIYVVDKKKIDDYRRFVVLAVGRGNPLKQQDKMNFEIRIPLTVKVGDVVYSSLQSGVQVSQVWQGKIKTYRIISENECVAYERFG